MLVNVMTFCWKYVKLCAQTYFTHFQGNNQRYWAHTKLSKTKGETGPGNDKHTVLATIKAIFLARSKLIYLTLNFDLFSFLSDFTNESSAFYPKKPNLLESALSIMCRLNITLKNMTLNRTKKH